jgi:hypothetical protein
LVGAYDTIKSFSFPLTTTRHFSVMEYWLFRVSAELRGRMLNSEDVHQDGISPVPFQNPSPSSFQKPHRRIDQND